MNAWQLLKLWKWWKTKGDAMLGALLANPTLRGWITKIGFLGFVLDGAVQLWLQYQHQEISPILTTGFPPMGTLLIGVVGFGLARKFQIVIDLLKASGMKLTPEQEAALTDAAQKTTPTTGG